MPWGPAEDASHVCSGAGKGAEREEERKKKEKPPYVISHVCHVSRGAADNEHYQLSPPYPSSLSLEFARDVENDEETLPVAPIMARFPR